MTDGRRRDDWCHTSAVLAMLVNVNRGSDTPARQPGDFNPYLKIEPKPLPKVGIDILKVFVKGV